MKLRWGFYLLTVTSCGILAAIFINRGQTAFAIGLLLVAGLYLVRGMVLTHKDNQRMVAELADEYADPQLSPDDQQIVNELMTAYRQMKGKRNLQYMLALLLILVIVYFSMTNVYLAFALSIILLVLGGMILQKTLKIRKIYVGLHRLNLFPET